MQDCSFEFSDERFACGEVRATRASFARPPRSKDLLEGGCWLVAHDFSNKNELSFPDLLCNCLDVAEESMNCFVLNV